MPCQQEYHTDVKRWIPAADASFGAKFVVALALVAFAASSSLAQTNGGHAAASSGSASHSVTTSRPSAGAVVTHPHHPGDPAWRPRRYVYGGVYAVGAPAPADAPSDAAQDDANYQGGPTIFDRRGSGAQSYIPPVADPPQAHAARQNAAAADPPAEDSAQEITTLVYKDGHQVEVGNYAIVGHSIYDMSPGRSLKVPLADLDLNATQKQNDQRGVRFQVPPKAQAN